MMERIQVEIRTCQLSDVEALANLSGQLGYPVSTAEMQSRIQHIRDDREHVVFVACVPPGTVVGWIDVGTAYHLQSGAYAEIGGLVVAEFARNRGVGRRLVEQAEAWARERELKKILVRSNVTRADAHRFYERENYIRRKTSAVFDKIL